MNNDGILEGFPRQDASGSDLLLDELEDLLACGAGVAQEPTQWCRDECRARQGQTERLCQHLTGAGAAHELAGTARRTSIVLGLLEVLLRKFAALNGHPHSPEVIRC